jgi:hypothetical protein
MPMSFPLARCRSVVGIDSPAECHFRAIVAADVNSACSPAVCRLALAEFPAARIRHAANDSSGIVVRLRCDDFRRVEKSTRFPHARRE